MWEWLLNGIKALFDSIFYIGREAWRQAGLLLANAWVWAASIGLALKSVFDHFEEGVAYIVGLSDFLLSAAFPQLEQVGPLTTLFTFANTFLPVTEGIAMLFTLALLVAAGTTYRFVKSWIPTPSSMIFPNRSSISFFVSSQTKPNVSDAQTVPPAARCVIIRVQA